MHRGGQLHDALSMVARGDRVFLVRTGDKGSWSAAPPIGLAMAVVGLGAALLG
jgi:hypothetical protein